MRRLAGSLLLLAMAAASAMAQSKKAAAPGDDALLRAMTAEIERSKALQFPALASPYYIEYAVDDALSFSCSASLGGILTRRSNRFRAPRIQVRVGTHGMDNTNFVLSDAGGGLSLLPLDDRQGPLRQYFWLATDAVYRSAVEIFASKRSAITNFVNADRMDDFTKAAPTEKILPAAFRKIDEAAWEARVRALSMVFASYPAVLDSAVEFESGISYAYMVNSEGSRLRVPDHLAYLRIRASGLAGDGAPVRDAVTFQAREVGGLPSEADMRAAAVRLAESVTALSKAPVGESYSGPVYFEAPAAAQLMAQLLGRNLAIPRTPVSFPGRPVPVLESELEGRMSARILPEFLSVVDDPVRKEWKGQPLLGSYEVDLEGVVPAPLRVVDRGNLEAFLLTRQPVNGGTASNGRARLPGAFGAKAAAISNLIVENSAPVAEAELRKRLMETAARRKKPYAILIRRLDFPSTASLEELRRMSVSMVQAGSARAVSIPLAAYKVYPDGREELVRGLRFKNVSVRSLRDIVAASGEVAVFDFINNTAPFAMVGGASFVTGSAVVSPALLFEELELERPQEELMKLPLVPPPSVAALK